MAYRNLTRSGSLFVAVAALGTARATAQEAAPPPTIDAGASPSSTLTAPPRGPMLSPERTHLLVDREGIAEQVDLSCRARVTLTVAAGTYVICDDSRLLHVQTDVTPAAIVRVPVDGEPVDLWDRGGQVWVEVVHRQAQSIGGQTAAPLPAPGAPPAPPWGAPSAPPAPPPPAQGPYPLPPTVWIPPPPGPRTNQWSPPRVGGWELEIGARPFMGNGAGIIGNASVTYRGENNRRYFIKADFEPLGGAVGDGENPWIAGLMLSAGFDHDMFEVGLGAGTSKVFVEKSDRFADGAAATVRQTIRIGARDGVYLHVHNTFTWIGDSIDWAGVYTALQIPLGDATWLIFRGAGGNSVRYAWGEIALRLLLSGTRDKGLFISPSLGGAAIFREPNADFESDEAHSGPMIGLNAEIRF